jgi:hypothetical protein
MTSDFFFLCAFGLDVLLIRLQPLKLQVPVHGTCDLLVLLLMGMYMAKWVNVHKSAGWVRGEEWVT